MSHVNLKLGLSDTETRVLGCLLEKQRTTPELYPLTLNSLRSACNQSTSREPVVSYDDAVIRHALHHLERRGLTRLASGQGSRAPKYRHLLAESLPMDGEEQAVVCVLMLRGPQTPGELKQRTERMRSFATLDAVIETLERLIERDLVRRLERRRGQKEERYAQLLEADTAEEERAPYLAPVNGVAAATDAAQTQGHGEPGIAPAASLEQRVERLERELAALRAQIAGGDGGTVP